jgi:hypothetical protein
VLVKSFLVIVAIAVINLLGAYGSYHVGKDYPWGVAVMSSGLIIFFGFCTILYQAIKA